MEKKLPYITSETIIAQILIANLFAVHIITRFFVSAKMFFFSVCELYVYTYSNFDVI